MAKKKNDKPEAPAKETPIEDEAPKKKKSKKLFVIIILVVLLGLLGAGGWFGYRWWMGRAPAAGPAAAKTPQKAANATAGGGAPHPGNATAGGGGVTGQLVSIPPLLVNLADPGGQRYLKLALDVEVRDKAAADELTKDMPKVKDALLLLLSSKSYADLATLEDKIMLKREIVDRLTLILGEQKVNRIYITEILIQ